VLTELHYTPTDTGTRDYVYMAGHVISAIDRSSSLPSGCGGEAKPDGMPQAITIDTPGGSASVTFEGSGCRRVSVLATRTGGTIGCFTIDIRRVTDSAVVGGPVFSCGTTGFLEPVVLPDGGEYRVTMYAGAGSGTATLQIYDVVDVEMPIAANGLPVPAELLTPGQNTSLPFTGTDGQRVSVLVNVTSGGFGCWTIDVWSVSPSAPGKRSLMLRWFA
jgi:hypothetical protein